MLISLVKRHCFSPFRESQQRKVLSLECILLNFSMVGVHIWIMSLVDGIMRDDQT